MKIGTRLYYYRSVIGHKIVVFYYTLKFCKRLLGKALRHDNSKFGEGEASVIAPGLRLFHDISYGTMDYEVACAIVKSALDLHYQCNTHHPEYFMRYHHEKTMSLLDRIEMVVDWAASSRKGVGVFKSIGINQKRFDFDEQQKQEYVDIAKAVEGK